MKYKMLSLLSLVLLATFLGQVPVRAQIITSWAATANGGQIVPQSVDSGASANLRFLEVNQTVSGMVNINDIKNLTTADLRVGNPSNTTDLILFRIWPFPSYTTNITTPSVSGSIEFPIRLTPADLVLGAGNYTDFLSYLQLGEVYFFVNTLNHPLGEIRGPVARQGTK